MNPLKAYARTQTETASRERLMVMLFEAGLRHMRNGAAAFDTGKNAEGIKLLGKASDIVQELLDTLKADVYPELCERLAGLYIFVLDRLNRAILSLTGKPALEAARAFEPVVLGFSEAVAKVEGGQVARP
jgi:flagellar protein FliS